MICCYTRVSTDEQSVAEQVAALAAEHGVIYRPTVLDIWAADVTRLAGDEVALDEVELRLVALERAGVLTRPAALSLQVSYLREKRAKV